MFATPMVGRAECDRAIAVIRVGGERRPAGARLRTKHAARPTVVWEVSHGIISRSSL